MILALRRWRQKDPEVRVVLGYIFSSRAAWALRGPNSQYHSPQIKSNKPTCGWTLPASASHPSTAEMEAEDQEFQSSPSSGVNVRSAWVTGDPVSKAKPDWVLWHLPESKHLEGESRAILGYTQVPS